jgi:hypothetical protein
MHDQRPVCFLLRYLQLQSIGVDVAYLRGHDGRDHHHLVRSDRAVMTCQLANSTYQTLTLNISLCSSEMDI